MWLPGQPEGWGRPDQHSTPGSYDIPDLPVDLFTPSSSASQYPRTPSEQYLPDNRAGQYIPGSNAPSRQFRPDVRRLTQVEQTAGGATLIVLISLFLPWFGFGANASVSGTAAHGYLVIVVLLAVLTAGYLLLQSGRQEFPSPLPASHQILLLTVTGLQFLLVAIAFFDVPAAGPGLWSRRPRPPARRSYPRFDGGRHAPGRTRGEPPSGSEASLAADLPANSLPGQGGRGQAR
jgi:hypothetical protein